jgi:hypothetical protein
MSTPSSTGYAKVIDQLYQSLQSFDLFNVVNFDKVFSDSQIWKNYRFFK